MKAKRYKNENDLYCVSIDFENNVPDQNIIEANYKIVADLMCSLYLSDLVSQVFHCIFEIIRRLPVMIYHMYIRNQIVFFQ